MKSFAIFILVCVFVRGQRHTGAFNEWWSKSGNTENRFFIESTLGLNTPDPCREFNRGRGFRNYLENQNIYCYGKWCNGGTFGCTKHGTANCYHVEHIIDLNGPVANARDKNIVANMVMAWGKWNMGLGGLARKYYADSDAEKTIVYGVEVMNAARGWITHCAHIRNTNTTNKPADEPYDPICDSENCDCNTDSQCGCDCDYELYIPDPFIPTYVIPVMVVLGAMFIGAAGGMWYVRRKNRAQQHSTNAIEMPTSIKYEQIDPNLSNPYASDEGLAPADKSLSSGQTSEINSSASSTSN